MVCCQAEVLKLLLYGSLQQIPLITTGDSHVLSKIRSLLVNNFDFYCKCSHFHCYSVSRYVLDFLCCSFQNPLFVDLFGTCHTEQVKPGIEKLLLLYFCITD